MSSRRSSGNVVVFIGTSAQLPATSKPSLVARARSRRMRSVARFRAVLINHARVTGDAVAWPSVGGLRERLLRGFLGEVKVAEKADQGGQDAAPFLAEDLLERGYQYTSEGRISTAPP